MGSAGGVLAIILANLVAIFLMRMIGKIGCLKGIAMARIASRNTKLVQQLPVRLGF